MEPENIDKVGALAFVITEGGTGGFVITNVDVLVVGMRMTSGGVWCLVFHVPLLIFWIFLLRSGGCGRSFCGFGFETRVIRTTTRCGCWSWDRRTSTWDDSRSQNLDIAPVLALSSNQRF